jgi:cold shock CspA family protein
MNEQRGLGIVKHFKEQGGYGFIVPRTPRDDGKDLFFHVSAWTEKRRDPREGDAVSFVVKTERDGRTRAGDVRIERER